MSPRHWSLQPVEEEEFEWSPIQIPYPQQVPIAAAAAPVQYTGWRTRTLFKWLRKIRLTQKQNAEGPGEKSF